MCCFREGRAPVCGRGSSCAAIHCIVAGAQAVQQFIVADFNNALNKVTVEDGGFRQNLCQIVSYRWHRVPYRCHRVFTLHMQTTSYADVGCCLTCSHFKCDVVASWFRPYVHIQPRSCLMMAYIASILQSHR